MRKRRYAESSKSLALRAVAISRRFNARLQVRPFVVGAMRVAFFSRFHVEVDFLAAMGS
jgi:hypothetical protein